MAVELLSTGTRRVLFAPLGDEGRGQIVMGRLRTAISLGVLAPGETLPAEADLAGQLNVSPVTLREALQQLRDQGLVTTRRGRGGGTVVAIDQRDQRLAAGELVAGMSRLDLRDMADMRRALATEAATLACRRASDGELHALVRAAAAFSAAVDPASARRADSRFFIELAAASQSVRLTTNLIESQVGYAAVLTLVYADAEIRGKVDRTVAAIVDAVGGGHESSAAEATREAIDLVGVAAADLRAREWNR